MKIQEVTSNVVIAEKNGKVRLRLNILGTQGAFLEKVTSDIDGFTDGRVVHQWDVQVVENTFVDDSKQSVQIKNRCKWFQINFDAKLI